MNVFSNPKILSLSQALSALGLSRSTFYKQLKQGLIPPPVHIGSRSVRWLEHELNAVLLARISGYTNNELKMLVEELIQQRKSFSLQPSNAKGVA